MDRRAFLQQSAATTALVATGLAACGKGDDDSTTTSPASGSGTTGGTTSGASTGTPDGTPAGVTTGTPGGTSTCASSPGLAIDSQGHGHQLTIPLADWQAGAGGSYVSTASNHSHTVQLTPQQMADLAANCTVTVNSNDTHAHTWVITIA